MPLTNTHPSIHFLFLLVIYRAQGSAGAYLGCQVPRGRVHPKSVASLSQAY